MQQLSIKCTPFDMRTIYKTIQLKCFNFYVFHLQTNTASPPRLRSLWSSWGLACPCGGKQLLSTGESSQHATVKARFGEHIRSLSLFRVVR